MTYQYLQNDLLTEVSPAYPGLTITQGCDSISSLSREMVSELPSGLQAAPVVLRNDPLRDLPDPQYFAVRNMPQWLSGEEQAVMPLSQLVEWSGFVQRLPNACARLIHTVQPISAIELLWVCDQAIAKTASGWGEGDKTEELWAYYARRGIRVIAPTTPREEQEALSVCPAPMLALTRDAAAKIAVILYDELLAMLRPALGRYAQLVVVAPEDPLSLCMLHVTPSASTVSVDYGMVRTGGGFESTEPWAKDDKGGRFTLADPGSAHAREIITQWANRRFMLPDMDSVWDRRLEYRADAIKAAVEKFKARMPNTDFDNQTKGTAE